MMSWLNTVRPIYATLEICDTYIIKRHFKRLEIIQMKALGKEVSISLKQLTRPVQGDMLPKVSFWESIIYHTTVWDFYWSLQVRSTS
jgi:hypothetical protein